LLSIQYLPGQILCTTDLVANAHAQVVDLLQRNN
jgi:hypothetical protein